MCDTWSILVLYCTGIVPVQYSTGTGSTGSTGSVEYLNRVEIAACAHEYSAGLSCTCGADAFPYTPHSWCPPLPHHWLPHHWLASPMIIARGGMHGGMHGEMQGKYYRYCSRSIWYSSTDLNSENNKFDMETFDLVSQYCSSCGF